MRSEGLVVHSVWEEKDTYPKLIIFFISNAYYLGRLALVISFLYNFI